MSGKLWSLPAPLRALARPRLTHRRRALGAAGGKRSSPRRCRLETLEQRTLLSVSPGAAEELPSSWNPRIDAAWFDELGAIPASEATGATLVATQRKSSSPTRIGLLT